jgi:hypothetical protein
MSQGDDFDYVTLEIEGGNESLLVDSLEYSIVVSGSVLLPLVIWHQRMTTHPRMEWQGLETDTPFLQLGSKTYQGHYEYVVGTHLYFEENLSELAILSAWT